LVRDNCILYGAPGTGKTEFVRELIRILIERYGEEPQKPEETTDPNNPNSGINREEELKEAQGKIARIPVFEISGAELQSAGPSVGDILPYRKLIKNIEVCKEKFFKNPDWDGKVGKESQ